MKKVDEAAGALNEAYPLARAYIKENPTACAQELQAWRDTGVYIGHHLENIATLLRPVSQYDCMKLADDLVLEYALKMLASPAAVCTPVVNHSSQHAVVLTVGNLTKEAVARLTASLTGGNPTRLIEIMPTPVPDVTNLPDAVLDATIEALGDDAYDNTRCWTAWSAGTMGPNDFTKITGQPDRVAEIAGAAISAWIGGPKVVRQTATACEDDELQEALDAQQRASEQRLQDMEDEWLRGADYENHNWEDQQGNDL